eukprot:m51a1_g8993 putative type i inositol- -bisphosphate 4-phosphatase (956) ;mRNA; f:87781-91289
MRVGWCAPDHALAGDVLAVLSSYALALLCALWCTLRQLAAGRFPFGEHKAFHLLLSSLLAMRVVAWTVALLDGCLGGYSRASWVVLVAATVPFCLSFATTTFLAVFMRVSAALAASPDVAWAGSLRKIVQLSTGARNALTFALWTATVVYAVVIVFAPAMTDSADAVFLLTSTFFEAISALFLIASTAYVWIAGHRVLETAPAAVCFLLENTLRRELSVGLVYVLVYVLPEVFPSVPMYLWVMRSRDKVKYKPLLLSIERSGLLAEPSARPPHLPSYTAFEGFQAVEYSVTLAMADDAIDHPVVVLYSGGSGAANYSDNSNSKAVEMDRTEVIPEVVETVHFASTLLAKRDPKCPTLCVAVFSARHGEFNLRLSDCVGLVEFQYNAEEAERELPLCCPTQSNRKTQLSPGVVVLYKERSHSVVGIGAALGSSCKTFVLETDDDYHDRPRKLFVKEELWESKNAFSVPQQMLSLSVEDRVRLLNEINSQIRQRSDIETARTGSTPDILHRIEETQDDRTNEQQLETTVQLFTEHLKSLKFAACQYRCDNQITFKPSSHKSDPYYQFVATNLHTQTMTVRELDCTNGSMATEGLYKVVTFGGPCAFCYGLEYGLRQLAQRLDALHHEQGPLVWKEEISLRLMMEMRTDVALSQIAAALADAFIAELDCCLWFAKAGRRRRSDMFFKQIAQCGFLVQFESLLSTFGIETAILGDFDYAVSCLNEFRLRLRPTPFSEVNQAVRVRRSETGRWVLEFVCPGWLLSEAPERLRKEEIAVTAVLFTQGINQGQVIANAIGDCSLQEQINAESLERLSIYFARYLEWLNSSREDTTSISRDFGRLCSLIQSPAPGSCFLPSAADFCRRLRAGRCTSCKSAKDRTAMSVTWEQTRILVAKHGLPEYRAAEVMGLMRASGVRRFNVIKNVGTDRYSFNALQQIMMPPEYRPPAGSGASGFRKVAT